MIIERKKLTFSVYRALRRSCHIESVKTAKHNFETSKMSNKSCLMPSLKEKILTWSSTIRDSKEVTRKKFKSEQIIRDDNSCLGVPLINNVIA